MYRVKDYNPGSGDWFWAKYGADGTKKISSCIDCHTTVKGDDYVFSVTEGK